MLEHIENLNDIFKKVANIIYLNGFVYIGELHPFKHHTDTKARFNTDAGQQIVTCFNPHISDFTVFAKQNNFEIIDIAEYFDNKDKSLVPRIITLLFQKK